MVINQSILSFLTGLLFFTVFACGEDINSDEQYEEVPENPKETLILISFDGFRYDYLSKANTPALDYLTENGVIADGLIPIFPTKTFPNHYTQVTGLYAENHGIISNTMYDPITDEMFSLGSEATQDGTWYEGEPIWVTAENQGLITATLFWPGSDAEIQGIRPTHYRKFDGAMPYTERTDQVIEWLSLPAKSRPDFMTLYFQSPDPEGHDFGPESNEVLAACESVDHQIQNLMTGINNLGLTNYVNLIIVSDHGMASISRDSVIFLDDYISLDDVFIVNWSPIADIIPYEGKEEYIYQSLSAAHPKLRVYKKEETPLRYHYKVHRRITPFVCIAENGWSISDRNYFNSRPDLYTGGAHGYDPSDPSMWGIFVASGPSFKKDLQIPAFESVHLYELMCHILNINPAPNDGNVESLMDIVRE